MANVRKLKLALLMLFVLLLYQGQSMAANADRFLKHKAWQCTFQAQLSSDIEEATGPAGMSHGPKRQFSKALGATGVKSKSPGGNTDSYHEIMQQSVKGSIRLHHVYDGGPDGIQIAGWNNGGAEVHIKNTFEGTEQKKTIFRDKVTTFNGVARFAGEEYEPPFQIWIYPDQNSYTIEYRLPPVRASQIEHCRMKEGMEGDRKRLESASDADIPLGGMFSGLTKFTCATERKGEVDVDGGALSGMMENIPTPSSGLTLAGEGESQFVDTRGVSMSWSCQPE